MKLIKLLILFVFILVILGGVFIFWFQKKATTLLNQTVNPSTSTPTTNLGTGLNPTSLPVSPASGEMLLSATPSSSLAVGQKITVTISLQADGKSVIGSDVILKFDPSLLRAETPIHETSYFDIYPRKTIDNKTGTISITAFRPTEKSPPVGPKGIASVVFTALKAGSGEISIDFVPRTTNHSTIVESGTSKNILGKAEPLSFTIGK